MNSLRLVLAVIVLALGFPTVANAAESAPPGNSAVDQYRESAAPSAPGSSKVSKERRERLAREGSDGAALADALDNNGGVATGTPETPSSADEAEAGTDADEAGGSSEKRASDSSPGSGTKSEGAASSPAGSKSSGQAGGPREVQTEKASTSAASATVGPFPVWVMVVAALAVVGLAAIARRRASA